MDFKFFLTKIFSTLAKGVSKARTKMVAAQREMRSPPMKYITTLNMAIWNIYIDWQVNFDVLLTSCG